MAKESTITKAEESISGNGLKIKNKAMASWSMETKIDTKENGQKDKDTIMEHTNTRMVIFMKAIGKMTPNQVKEL